MIWASADIKSGIYIKTLNRAHTDKHIVAVTFDDGPDPIQTPKVLDVLDEYSAKATFFVIGQQVEQHQTLTNEIIKRGHTIANHTHSHSARYTIASNTKVTKQIEQCTKAIENATGLRPSLFRPPFGVTNPIIRRIAKQMHLTVIGWSIRTLDTMNISNPEKTRKRVARLLHPGAIILLHDRLPLSDVTLRLILHEITSRQYSVVPLSELLNITPYEY